MCIYNKNRRAIEKPVETIDTFIYTVYFVDMRKIVEVRKKMYPRNYL
jgi:hypothetical protein